MADDDRQRPNKGQKRSEEAFKGGPSVSVLLTSNNSYYTASISAASLLPLRPSA